MMPSMRATGTLMKLGLRSASSNRNSPCSKAVHALPGPAHPSLNYISFKSDAYASDWYTLHLLSYKSLLIILSSGCSLKNCKFMAGMLISITSNWKHLVGFGRVFDTVCHEGSQVRLTDGLACSQAPISKHHIWLAFLHQLHLWAHKCSFSKQNLNHQCRSMQAAAQTFEFPFRRFTCPATDLKKAVGRTMEYVMSPAACSADSNLSLACWNSRRGFCTQIALSSTKCDAPFCLAASSAFIVAW